MTFVQLILTAIVKFESFCYHYLSLLAIANDYATQSVLLICPSIKVHLFPPNARELR